MYCASVFLRALRYRVGGDGVVVVRVVGADVKVDDPWCTARILQDKAETNLSAACW